MNTTVASDLPAALFGSIASEAIACASGRGLRLPEDLAHNRHGDTTFEARFASLPAGGELRTVHIHGPRIEIINVFHFPAPERALPIYALELVVFGRRPVVGVIDAKPLCAHPYAETVWRKTLESAHASFTQLTPAHDPPGWYEQCRSGLDFFTRPEHFNGLGQLLACHAHVWSRLAAAQAAAPRLSEAETAAHAEALASYKHHHHVNFPGLPFLSRSFGAEWTDRFLNTAFFA